MIKKDRAKTIFLILFLLNLAFIWGNSLLSIPQSRALSDAVITLFGRLLGVPVMAGADGVEGSHLIRKLAHFTEFASLGVWCSLLFSKREWDVSRFKTVVIWGLTVPLLDEGLQIITARGSALIDCFIDMLGFALGAAAVLTVLYLERRKTI